MRYMCFGWLVVSVIFLNAYFVFGAHSFIAFYYILWLGIVGIPVWRKRDAIASYFQKKPGFMTYAVLAFGMVLLEEVLASLANTLAVTGSGVGLSLGLWFARIPQFWAFNILAFAGPILAWYVLYKRYAYRASDILWISAAWGLFAEKIIAQLPNPLIFILFAPPTMATYALIMAPAIWSLGESRGRPIGRVRGIFYGLALPFFLSLPFILIVSVLRSHFPGAFPPCSIIAC